jgi:hypothetical protein
VSVLMNAPHGVTSASVPSQAVVTTVTSPTGLVRPVYPENSVYVVSGGQIAADPLDVSELVKQGFIVASQATTAPRKQPAGNPVIDGKWPIY